MSGSSLKNNFHLLIDSFRNEKLLKKFYTILHSLKEKELSDEKDWWDSLTPEQKNELDLAIKESEDELNWVKYSIVAEESAKWLKK